MTEEEIKLMEKSEEAIKAAEKLLEGNFFSAAANRAYYSMFYSAQALLKSRGIEVAKHSAVEGKFGEHFAKTKEIDPKFHGILKDTRDVRERADYSISDVVIGSVVIQKVEEAKLFLEMAKATLANKLEEKQNKSRGNQLSL